MTASEVTNVGWLDSGSTERTVLIEAVRKSCERKHFSICPFNEYPHDHEVYRKARALAPMHCADFGNMANPVAVKQRIATFFDLTPGEVWPGDTFEARVSKDVLAAVNAPVNCGHEMTTPSRAWVVAFMLLWAVAFTALVYGVAPR